MNSQGDIDLRVFRKVKNSRGPFALSDVANEKVVFVF